MRERDVGKNESNRCNFTSQGHYHCTSKPLFQQAGRHIIFRQDFSPLYCYYFSSWKPHASMKQNGAKTCSKQNEKNAIAIHCKSFHYSKLNYLTINSYTNLLYLNESHSNWSCVRLNSSVVLLWFHWIQFNILWVTRAHTHNGKPF